MSPIVEYIGGVAIRHGERGHELDPDNPEACLCGHPDYWKCDSWLMGWDTVGGLTISRNDDGTYEVTR